MDEKKSIWLKNPLIIPLAVALIVVIFQFVLPKLFEKGNELSYSLEEPKTHLDQNTIGDIKVKINNIETSLLVSQSARIWNSGGLPIKMLPIKYIFETSSSTFKILMVNHNTKPKYEFGNITSTETDQYSRRFVYDLLNPGDEATIIFLTNEVAPLSVYAKGEGLSIKLIKPGRERLLFGLGVMMGAILSFLLAFFQSYFVKKLKRKRG